MIISDIVIANLGDLWLVWWLLSGFIGCLIGYFQNRKGTGLIMGLVFGPIGWILMLFDRGPALGYAFLFICAVAGIIATPFMIQSAKEETARQEKAEQQRGAMEQQRQIAEHQKELEDKRAEWAALPKEDDDGKPINRTPPPEIVVASPTPAPTPVPMRTPTPQEVAAWQARAAAQQAAAIARKYSGQ